MSEPPPSAEPYRIDFAVVAVRALEGFRDRAIAAGRGRLFLDALKQVKRILRIYPQFGEPLRELRQAGHTVYASCILTVAPLVVEYILDELNRRVIVVTPPKLLPHSGFE